MIGSLFHLKYIFCICSTCAHMIIPFHSSVRVSNELGMRHPRAARYSVYVTLFQSLLLGILCMIVVLATRNYFSYIFSDSEDMRRAVAHLSWLLGITMLLNSVQPVISGIWFTWIQLFFYLAIVPHVRKLFPSFVQVLP